jgi:hypothetical protein
MGRRKWLEYCIGLCLLLFLAVSVEACTSSGAPTSSSSTISRAKALKTFSTAADVLHAIVNVAPLCEVVVDITPGQGLASVAVCEPNALGVQHPTAIVLKNGSSHPDWCHLLVDVAGPGPGQRDLSVVFGSNWGLAGASAVIQRVAREWNVVGSQSCPVN